MPSDDTYKWALAQIKSLNIAYLGECRASGEFAARFERALGHKTQTWLRQADTNLLKRFADTPFLLCDLGSLVLPTPGEQLQVELAGLTTRQERSFVLLVLSFARELGTRDSLMRNLLCACSANVGTNIDALSLPELRAFADASELRLTPVIANLDRFWQDWCNVATASSAAEQDAIKSSGLQHVLQRESAMSLTRRAARSQRSPAELVAR